MKPIEERKKEFKINIWKACGENEERYTKHQMWKFWNYWSQHNEPVRKNTKMLFEEQKKFQILNRMATFFKSNPKRYAKKEVKRDIDKLMRL